MDSLTLTIGAVLVFHGVQRPRDNEARPGVSLQGDERVEALTLWAQGGDTRKYTFWGQPGGSGLYRLNDPDQVNWDTSGIERQRGFQLDPRD